MSARNQNSTHAKAIERSEGSRKAHKLCTFTGEAPLVSRPTILGGVSWSAVLCLSLSTATQAQMKHDPCADRKGGEPNLVACEPETRQGIETIKGEVLRVEGENYVVERFNGKEGTLQIDQTTKMTGRIGKGDRIEANVGEANEQKHVRSVRQLE